MGAVWEGDRRGYDFSGVGGNGLDNEETHAASRRVKAMVEANATFTHAGTDWDTSTKTLVMYVARFTGDEPDKVGDVIDPSAFDSWYSRWKADPMRMYPSSSGKLPIVHAHSWSDANALIGFAGPEDVTIDTRGLLVAARLFDTETAQHVWAVARDMGWGASFAFDIAKGGEKKVKRNGKTFNLLMNFQDIHECGSCLLGAEPTAGTMSVHATDRTMAEFKSLYAQASQHPSVVTRQADDVFAAGARRLADLKAANVKDYPEPARCYSCGGLLPKWTGRTVEFLDEADNVTGTGGLRWAECANCGKFSLGGSKSVGENIPVNEAIDMIRDTITVETERIVARETSAHEARKAEATRARKAAIKAENARIDRIVDAQMLADDVDKLLHGDDDDEDLAHHHINRAQARKDLAEIEAFLQSVERGPR
ncbi:MAG: hypothetical protein M3Q30_23950 [Actinomycetota bacterium]|nr:hypothetical protein [Actinomycetota bacterium]